MMSESVQDSGLPTLHYQYLLPPKKFPFHVPSSSPFDSLSLAIMFASAIAQPYVCAPKFIFPDATPHLGVYGLGGYRCWVSPHCKPSFSKSAWPSRLACDVSLLGGLGAGFPIAEQGLRESA